MNVNLTQLDLFISQIPHKQCYYYTPSIRSTRSEWHEF